MAKIEPEARPVACDDCDWTGTEADLTWPPPDLHLRLDPGGTVPAGECPECGVLAYLVPIIPHRPPEAKEPISVYCDDCGGTNVMRDAWAVWSNADQEWELGTVFDQGFCDDCGGESSLEERPLSDGEPNTKAA